MKKLLIVLLGTLLFTGCGCSKKETTETKINNENDEYKEETVVEDQKFEGLEFVNISAKDGIVKTVVINNTGYRYEGSKFKMKIMDENSNILTEEIDEIKEPMETGTTREIQTKTKADLTKAATIEYSVISR